MTWSTSSAMPSNSPKMTPTTLAMKTSTFSSILNNIPKLWGVKNFCNWEFALGIAIKHIGCYNAIASVMKKPLDLTNLADWEARVANGLTVIGLTVKSL
jgi:hypothetical protein